MPSRVILQDFTGVPVVADLAALRDEWQAQGGDPEKINPVIPVDLVIDHSVMIDCFGSSEALQCNIAHEYERNQERYRFLKWAQNSLQI
jgi:aconitate hydratase